jgi:riboflavin synthase
VTFTGIVEEVGRVRALVPARGGARVEVAARAVLADASVGSSIAVDGCCLTVVALGDGWWAADVAAETLRRTALGDRRRDDPVNLERPLRLADRLGGHLVQGHVDATGVVRDRRGHGGGAIVLRVEAPASVGRFVVEKGSIAVDGVSLTVAACDGAGFSVVVVPHTLAATSLGARRPGDRVNLEADVIAKYVERLTAAAVPGAAR